MAINFEPKIGQILECNYGGYQYDENAWLSLEGLKRTSCLSAIPARPFQLESQLLADSVEKVDREFHVGKVRA